MTSPALKDKGKFVLMRPNPEVDSHLSAKTLKYLHTVGMPNSDELSFNFTGRISLKPDNLIVFDDNARKIKYLCIDLQQGELIRWANDPQSFINSSVEQFAQSVIAFEYYIEHIQAKHVFGPYYDNTGSIKNRPAYANALAEKLRAIDPVIFERGYYWPAFIEEIESGL